MRKGGESGMREGRSGRQSASTFPNRFIPLYYQLENILRSKIEGGEVPQNHKLPTEQELSREYKISRATVRQALAALVSEGLLFRKQGKGTFVTEKAGQTKSVKLTGFTEDLFSEGHQAEVKVMEKCAVPAPERVATLLRVPVGEGVIRFKRLRSVDGGPFSYVLSYLTTEIGEQISEKDLQSHTMLHLLEEKLGISLGTIRHAVESAKANIEVASLLGISVFEPVLYIETAVFAAEGQPVEVVDSFFRADRYRYTVELIRSQQLRKDRAKRR
ncbi:MAG TPA: GntR family transcriptional regulator [Candidatus Methylomirabilis sp.]